MKVRKFLWELKLKSRLLVNEFRVRWNHPSWECQNDLRNFWWIIFSSHTSASVFVFHILICIFRKFFIILLWLSNLLWSIIMFRFILTFLFIYSINKNLFCIQKNIFAWNRICDRLQIVFSFGVFFFQTPNSTANCVNAMIKWQMNHLKLTNQCPFTMTV